MHNLFYILVYDANICHEKAETESYTVFLSTPTAPYNLINTQYKNYLSLWKIVPVNQIG